MYMYMYLKVAKDDGIAALVRLHLHSGFPRGQESG